MGGRRVLVTGDRGVLGSEVTRLAQLRGWEVKGLRRGGDDAGGGLDMVALGECLSDWAKGPDPGLDLLVYCASARSAGRLEHVPPALAATSIRVDLEGTVNSVRLALPLLQRRSGSAAVIVSSMAAFHGVPSFASYAAAKAGQLAFAQALSMELADGPPSIVTLVLGTLHGDGMAKTEFWTAGGRARLGKMRPFRFFRSADTPLSVERVAERILEPHRRSRTIYLPGSLVWLHRVARFAPGMIRLFMRLYETRRLRPALVDEPRSEL